MKPKTSFAVLSSILLTTLVLAGCSSHKPAAKAPGTPGAPATLAPLTECTITLPSSAFPAIQTPGPDISPDMARFSGAWEGTNNGVNATLVVISLTPTEATSAYSYGQLSGSLVSQFQPDGTLHQGGTGEFQFDWKMGASGTSLLATRTQGATKTSYAMRKCTLQP